MSNGISNIYERVLYKWINAISYSISNFEMKNSNHMYRLQSYITNGFIHNDILSLNRSNLNRFCPHVESFGRSLSINVFSKQQPQNKRDVNKGFNLKILHGSV